MRIIPGKSSLDQSARQRALAAARRFARQTGSTDSVTPRPLAHRLELPPQPAAGHAWTRSSDLCLGP